MRDESEMSSQLVCASQWSGEFFEILQVQASPAESDSVNLMRPGYEYLKIFPPNCDITCRQEYWID
jgi:hypothetical protein